MAAIVGLINTLGLEDLSSKFESVISDSDFSNRLTYKTTPKVLGSMLLLVIYMQYANPPMSCWFPDTKNAVWKDYINSYCWSESFYHPAIKVNKTRVADMSRFEYASFQWVPFVLVSQILLLFLPDLIWQAIFIRSPINISNVFKVALQANCLQPGDERTKYVTQLRKTFKKYLKTPKKECLPVVEPENKNVLQIDEEDCEIHRSTLGITEEFVNEHGGKALICCDFLVKFSYVINCFGQIIIMYIMFDFRTILFGIEAIYNIFSELGTELPYVFPRVIYCQVLFEEHSTPQTARCSVLINMYNEKIFTFLWFWYIGIGLAECLSFIFKVYAHMIAKGPNGFLRSNLGLLRDQETKMNRESAHTFITANIRHDGIFVLHTISNQVSPLLCADLMMALWKRSLTPSSKNCKIQQDEEKEIQKTEVV